MYYFILTIIIYSNSSGSAFPIQNGDTFYTVEACKQAGEAAKKNNSDPERVSILYTCAPFGAQAQ